LRIFIPPFVESIKALAIRFWALQSVF
jgi:hypothetical protein